MKKNFSPSKTNIYWLLQIFGWFSISFSGFLNELFIAPDSFDYMSIIDPINIILPGIITTHIYKERFLNPTLFSQSSIEIFLAGIKAVLLVSLSILVFSNLYYFFVYNNAEYLTIKFILIQFLNACVYISCWFIIYFFYKILERNQEIASRKLQLEMKTKSSELELLKSQLNPEFLFQSLDSLRIMALKDKNVARDSIIKLSELLRFSLNYDKKPFITLEQEFSEVKKYLELHQMKPDNNLSFTIDLVTQHKEQMIPPALLLTLTEQIVQNMVPHTEETTQLNISCTVKMEKVYLEFSIQSKNKLENYIDSLQLEKRMEHYYGPEARISVEKLSPYFTSITLIYPIVPLKNDYYELQSNNH